MSLASSNNTDILLKTVLKLLNIQVSNKVDFEWEGDRLILKVNSLLCKESSYITVYLQTRGKVVSKTCVNLILENNLWKKYDNVGLSSVLKVTKQSSEYGNLETIFESRTYQVNPPTVDEEYKLLFYSGPGASSGIANFRVFSYATDNIVEIPVENPTGRYVKPTIDKLNKVLCLTGNGGSPDWTRFFKYTPDSITEIPSPFPTENWECVNDQTNGVWYCGHGSKGVKFLKYNDGQFHELAYPFTTWNWKPAPVFDSVNNVWGCESYNNGVVLFQYRAPGAIAQINTEIDTGGYRPYFDPANNIWAFVSPNYGTDNGVKIYQYSPPSYPELENGTVTEIASPLTTGRYSGAAIDPDRNIWGFMPPTSAGYKFLKYDAGTFIEIPNPYSDATTGSFNCMAFLRSSGIWVFGAGNATAPTRFLKYSAESNTMVEVQSDLPSNFTPNNPIVCDEVNSFICLTNNGVRLMKYVDGEMKTVLLYDEYSFQPPTYIPEASIYAFGGGANNGIDIRRYIPPYIVLALDFSPETPIDKNTLEVNAQLISVHE